MPWLILMIDNVSRLGIYSELQRLISSEKPCLNGRMFTMIPSRCTLEAHQRGMLRIRATVLLLVSALFLGFVRANLSILLYINCKALIHITVLFCDDERHYRAPSVLRIQSISPDSSQLP